MKERHPVKAIGMGGRQVLTGPEYGQIYDHFSVVYEYADGARLFSNCRQQPGCKNDMSAQVLGTKGTRRHRGAAQGLADRIDERTWHYDGPENKMYQTEHDELFASIRSGRPINNGDYMAASTLLAIMGRMAAYTGPGDHLGDGTELQGRPQPGPLRLERRAARCRHRRAGADAVRVTCQRIMALIARSTASGSRIRWPDASTVKRKAAWSRLAPPLARAFARAGLASRCSPAADRRSRLGPAAALGSPRPARGRLVEPIDPSSKRAPSRRFQIACMTLPYSQFPLQRALTGIKAAGYRYVAWGTSHVEENGKQTPVIAADAPPAAAKELGKRCRDLGLEPLLMFSGIYPEDPDGLEVLKKRIRQAEAGGIAQVLTFGHTKGGNRKLWVERFRQLGPMARDHGVTIVVKQHGGETGTGAACAEIVREVNDAGHQGQLRCRQRDGLPRTSIPSPTCAACFGKCAASASRTIATPRATRTAGPGFGEIDHYKLLGLVAFTGRDDAPLLREHLRPALAPSRLGRGSRRAGSPGPRVS